MLLDSWFNHPRSLFRSPFFTLDPWPLERAQAPARVADTGESIVLTMDIPGVPESDVQLTTTGQTLTVRFTRDPKVPDGYVVHQRERRAGTVTRSFRLPGPIDAAAARATVKDGVLTVTLPRAAAAPSRTIPVQVEAHPQA